MDILDAIDRTARDSPEKIAHLSGGRTLTYQALKRDSDALAVHFTERFPGNKSPVAIIGHKEPEMFVEFPAGGEILVAGTFRSCIDSRAAC